MFENRHVRDLKNLPILRELVTHRNPDAVRTRLIARKFGVSQQKVAALIKGLRESPNSWARVREAYSLPEQLRPPWVGAGTAADVPTRPLYSDSTQAQVASQADARSHARTLAGNLAASSSSISFQGPDAAKLQVRPAHPASPPTDTGYAWRAPSSIEIFIREAREEWTRDRLEELHQLRDLRRREREMSGPHPAEEVERREVREAEKKKRIAEETLFALSIYNLLEAREQEAADNTQRRDLIDATKILVSSLSKLKQSAPTVTPDSYKALGPTIASFARPAGPSLMKMQAELDEVKRERERAHWGDMRALAMAKYEVEQRRSQYIKSRLKRMKDQYDEILREMGFFTLY